MNDDKPKSVWKKSFKGRTALAIWLAVTIFAIMSGSFIIARLNNSQPMSDRFSAVGILAGAFLAACLTLIYIVWPPLRWLIWKHWRRTLFGLACLATLIAIFYAEEDWRGKHDWEKFKRQWEANGERFDLNSLAPPPVPDEQNFAFSPVWIAEIRRIFQAQPERAEAWYGDRIYNEEVSKLFPLVLLSVSGLTGTNWLSHSSHLPNPPEQSGRWALAQTTDLKPWQAYYREVEKVYSAAEIPVLPQSQSPVADVLLALSKFNPIIEKLRQDSTLPDSRFPLDYTNEDPAVILLPHLAVVKRYGQLLQLRAVAELQNGQSDQALADVKLMLRLVDSVRAEPILISHLVRIAILQLALQPIYEGLARHQWSDAQLAELDSELAKLDFLVDYRLSMRGARACNLGFIEFIQRNIYNLRDALRAFGENDYAQESAAVILYHLCPSGWFYQNELHIGRFYQNWYLPLVNETERTVSPSAVQATYAALDSELHYRTPENFLEPWLLPALGAAVQKFAYAQESADLARVAIALERYRLAHGEYPESLDSLAPQFMAKIPHDIINGQPLHYRRTTDGQFVLYSVGWNETDDGGVIVLYKGSSDRVDITKGDWVWRYPSK